MEDPKSILVVEDDNELRPIITCILEDEGYLVEAAESGSVAVERAKQRKFDLVLSDVRMEGMDGLEVAQAIRAVLPKVPLIVITGYASQDVPIRAIKQQAFDYLHKPFELDELLRCVEEALHADTLAAKIAQLASTLAVGAKPPQMAFTEEGRQRVFQMFYVAIRSGKLSQIEALHAWEKLEEVENRRLQGEAGYEEVEQLLTAAAAQEFVPLSTYRNLQSVDRDAFGQFFTNIKDGNISQHELTLAPFLRRLEGEGLANSTPELQALRQRIWGT